MKKLISTTKNYIKLNKRATIFVLVLILGFLVGSAFAGGDTPTEDREERTLRSVEIASVNALSQDSVSLPVLGKVKSVSEAVIRTESQGEIRRLTKSLGDRVFAGEIIAEFENSLERAAVLQAEARVEQAEVSSSISDSQLTNAELALTEAKTQAINTLRAAYASADGIVRRDVDAFITNEFTSSPQLLFNPPDFQLRINLETGRTDLERILSEWDTSLDALVLTSDLEGALALGEAHVAFLRNYLDDAGQALNTYNPSTSEEATVNGWRTSVATARATVGSLASSISGAKDRLNGANTALIVAQSDAATGEGSSLSSASLKQAEAGLTQARAALEKTIVRSPISGTLNSLTLERGDFVGAFQEVATVANNNALEIVGYITSDDRSRIEVGSVVLVEGGPEAVVTRIAPALDPVTKKIEIKVGFKGEQPDLTNGSSVRLEVIRETQEVITDEIIIPISALKIESEGNFVFTVNEESELIPQEVEVGALLGENIQIVSGITSDMFIVTDARGLKAGQKVTVNE